MNFITNASPVVREGPLCEQNVRDEREAEGNHTVVAGFPRNDLRFPEELGGDVDQGGENDRSMNAMRFWV